MKGLAAAALLLALLLPGCAAPAGTLSPASASVTTASPLAFAAPHAMDQPSSGAEPNVAVGADGTLWITAVAGSQERPNAMQGAAWLWHSKDNGSTWQTLRAPQRDTPLGSLPDTRRPFGSSDADVTTSRDGWTYYTDWWNWGSPVVPPVGGTPAGNRYGSYLVEASGDGGATWTSAPVTTLDSVGGIDRQWLVAGDNGTVGLFYAYFHGVQNTVRNAGDLYGRGDAIMSIEAVWSHDHGRTWSDPAPVVPPASLADLQIAHPRYVGNHTFVMPYGWTDDTYGGSDSWHSPSQVRVMVSRDDGQSWSGSKVADAPGGFDNLWAVQGAVDATGRAFVAWAARTNDTMTVFVSESSDLRTWSAPVALRAEGLNFLPWVAARGDGTVSVVWYGGNSTGDPTKAPKDATWLPYVATRAGEGQPWRVGLVSATPIKTGPLCPKGAACGSDREVLDYLSDAYDAAGRLHVAYAVSRDLNGAKAGLVTYAASVAPQP